MASNANKRRRKKRRQESDADPEFQVAPMVDVLLVLLLFFMSITSTELLKKVKNVQLPDAKNGSKADPQKKREIVVNVAWDGIKGEPQFSMDGVNYPDAASMEGNIATQAKAKTDGYVLIRADRDVPYSNISDLMTTCASAGIGTVTFAVITGGGDAKAPEGGATK